MEKKMTKDDFYKTHAPDLDFEKNKDELLAYALEVGFICETKKGHYEYCDETVCPILC